MDEHGCEELGVRVSEDVVVGGCVKVGEYWGGWWEGQFREGVIFLAVSGDDGEVCWAR